MNSLRFYAALWLLSGLLWLPLVLAGSHESKAPLVTLDNPTSVQVVTITKVQSLKLPYTHGVVHAKVQGNAASPIAVLFVHGTPGSADAFIEYLSDAQLNTAYLNVSIDRPGWGMSTQHSGDLGEFVITANAALAIMHKYKDKQWVIVGHSLGASMAPTVMLEAAKDGIRVSHLILLAGSLEPKLAGPRWFNRLASTWLARVLLSEKLNQSNREIMRLQGQLSEQESKLNALSLQRSTGSGPENTAAVVIQGLRDSLVSPQNLSYARKNLRKWFCHVELVALTNEGHFLPWRQYELVKQHLLKLQLEHSCG